MNIIKGDIVTGVLARGERIESVRSLSEKFGVNLNTMQRACSELEREQVITTQRGVGSFVTEDEAVISKLKHEMSTEMVMGFLQGMYSLGFKKTEIVEIIRKVIEL
jgi:DNA-binding transcriptional regulator YhcF (GntR family)